jgi:hypothetical protein
MLRLLHVETDKHPGCFKMMPSNTDTSTRGCFTLENIRFSLLYNETITSWVCSGLRPFHTQAIIYWGFFVLEPWYAEASLCWGCFNAGSFYIEVIKCWDSLIPEGFFHSEAIKLQWTWAVSIPVKQEVNGTLILPPLVFPGASRGSACLQWKPKNYNKKCARLSSAYG